MRHLLACACIFAFCLSAPAQDAISTEDPFSLEPPTGDGADAQPAASGPTTDSVPAASVLEEIAVPTEDSEAAQVDEQIEDDALETTLRGASLIGVTEPKSVPGIIRSVSDADGNEYPIVVAQPMEIAPSPVRWSRQDLKEVTETIETATGETKAVSKSVFTEAPVDGIQVVATPQSPVFVPLLPSMQCFQIKDGLLQPASASELAEDTHVLVTYSTADAMDVADGLYEAFNARVALTGLKPQLPGYLLALNISISDGAPESLGDFLKTASPYRGSVTFFGDLQLNVETDTTDESLADYFEYPRDSEIAWSYARQDFFAGRYATSEPILNSLIEAEAKEPMVYYLRGLLRYGRGDANGANVDFTDGAKLESRDGYSNEICRALERVQGPARLALERHRRGYTR